MTNRFIKTLWMVLISLLLSGCNFQGKTSNDLIETTTEALVTAVSNGSTVEVVATEQHTMATVGTDIPDPDPPLALVSLIGQTVHFECLDRETCIPDIDLKGYIHLDSYHLGRIYYWNPESVYITLLSKSAIPETMDIIHSNPQTGEIKSIKSPDEAESTVEKISAGRLILAKIQGQTFYIVESDLSINKIDVGVDIHTMIVVGNKVIVLNNVPVEKDGQILIDVSVVNVVSQQVFQKRLNLPGLEISRNRQTPEPNTKYLSLVEGVSEDLKNLYCTFISGDEPRIVRLGTFSVEHPGEIVSILEPVAPFGFGQYRWMLFRSYLGESESGISSGSLYDMSTGRSLIDYDKNPEWSRKKLWVVPFGDYFLLGRSDEIVLLSFTGTILERYALPDRWINQDYNIVRFEN